MKDPILICAAGSKYDRHAAGRMITWQTRLARTHEAFLHPAGTL
jgi:hypothetical protein